MWISVSCGGLDVFAADSTYIADDSRKVAIRNGSNDQVDFEIGLARVAEGDFELVGISRDQARSHCQMSGWRSMLVPWSDQAMISWSIAPDQH